MPSPHIRRSSLAIRFKFWLDRLQYCGPLNRKKRCWHHTLRRWFGRTLYRSHAFLFRGARRVETVPFHGTDGLYIAAGVYIEFDGACPVQGRGEVDGYLCYYRSRGEGWQFHASGEPVTEAHRDLARAILERWESETGGLDG